MPAWAFHLDGLPQPVLRVAVAALASLEEIEPQVPGTDRTRGLVPASALLAEQGRTITVRMSVDDCAPAVTPQVLETATIVVVGATLPVPSRRNRDECAAVVRDSDVTLTLGSPLGHRILVTAGGRLVVPVPQRSP